MELVTKEFGLSPADFELIGAWLNEENVDETRLESVFDQIYAKMRTDHGCANEFDENVNVCEGGLKRAIHTVRPNGRGRGFGALRRRSDLDDEKVFGRSS